MSRIHAEISAEAALKFSGDFFAINLAELSLSSVSVHHDETELSDESKREGNLAVRNFVPRSSSLRIHSPFGRSEVERMDGGCR